MVFVFDLGGVLSDIDVQGFLNPLHRLMPEDNRRADTTRRTLK